MSGEKCENILEFISESKGILDEKRKKYEEYRDNIVSSLEKLLDVYFPSLKVHGRVKGTDNLNEKIYRKNYYSKYDADPERFIQSLPDGIGIRIVSEFNRDEKEIFNRLRYFSQGTDVINNENVEFICSDIALNFNNQPEFQNNGLAIYRLNGYYKANDDYVRFELQIKSQTHEYWGEIEHALVYKNHNYVINGDYYSSLIGKIYQELEIIDSELSELSDNLIMDEEKEREESINIAARLISKEFSQSVSEELNCSIDLREVYVVLAGINFPSTNNTSLEKLTVLSNKLSGKSSALEKYYLNLNDSVLNIGDIAANNHKIAKCIDSNIRKQDVYWRYLFCIFQAIENNDDSYSQSLDALSKRISTVFAPRLDSICEPYVADESIDFLPFVRDVVFDLILIINKISYLTLELCLERVMGILEEEIEPVANSILLTPAYFSDDKETIHDFLLISILLLLDHRISNDTWKSLKEHFEKNDSYDLRFSKKAEAKIIDLYSKGELSREIYRDMKDHFNVEDEEDC